MLISLCNHMIVCYIALIKNCDFVLWSVRKAVFLTGYGPRLILNSPIHSCVMIWQNL